MSDERSQGARLDGNQENAVDYVKAHNLAACLHDEVTPNQVSLAEFAPVAFACPYRALNTTIDTTMLTHFKLWRTIGAENCLK